MTKKSSKTWNGCPIRFGSCAMGDPWKMLILRDLMFKGAQFYADFLNAGEKISTNILASRLTELEEEGIVHKEKDPTHGARFIYRLTDKGLDLLPPMLSLMDWSQRWDERTEVPKEFSDGYRQDPDGFTQMLLEGLRERHGDHHL